MKESCGSEAYSSPSGYRGYSFSLVFSSGLSFPSLPLSVLSKFSLFLSVFLPFPLLSLFSLYFLQHCGLCHHGSVSCSTVKIPIPLQSHDAAQSL